MRVVRVVGLLVLCLLAVAAVTAMVGYLRFVGRRDTTHTPPSFIVSTSEDPDILARGEHIARTIGGCADCHAPDFGGRLMAETPMLVMAAPNLTKGRGGVTAEYHGDDWLRAIAYGVHRDGRSLVAMPSDALGEISTSDIAAMASYLAQVPPVDRDVVTTEVRPFGAVVFGLTAAPIFSAESAANRKGPEVTPEPSESRAYGQYLLGVCHGCHGAELKGGTAVLPGAPLSADISPAAMASWTFDDLDKALRAGKRKSGGIMNPDEMPWRVTAGLTPSEMRAVWLALRRQDN